jgi:hypothetical protein
MNKIAKGVKPFCMLTLALLMATPFALIAEESAIEGLERCALINTTANRLACYDKLSGRAKLMASDIESTQGKPVAESTVQAAVEVVPTPSPIVIPTPPPKQQSVVQQTPASPVKQEPAQVLSDYIAISSCARSGGNKKFTFYLADGQVWKQVSSKRLPFDTCGFNVKIEEDFFGYKMQLENDDLKFRVSRVR